MPVKAVCFQVVLVKIYFDQIREEKQLNSFCVPLQLSKQTKREKESVLGFRHWKAHFKATEDNSFHRLCTVTHIKETGLKWAES